MKRALLVCSACALFACGGAKSQLRKPLPARLLPELSAPPSVADPPPPPEGIERVIAAARKHLGKTTVRVGGKSFRYDCSGFVRGMVSALGIDLMSEGGDDGDNGVRLIHHYVDRHGLNHLRKVPQAGDIVFFDNTWDKNGNGLLDDPLTHVGLVEEVRADGTALIIHRANRGIVRDPMNLLHPHELKDEHGAGINAWLRPKGRRENADTPHLMSELWAGFGTLRLEVGVALAGAGDERQAWLEPLFADCGCEP